MLYMKLNNLSGNMIANHHYKFEYVLICNQYIQLIKTSYRYIFHEKYAKQWLLYHYWVLMALITDSIMKLKI